MKLNQRGERLIKSLFQPSNLLLLVILLLALLLRLKGITTRDIWYDEALDVAQASKTLVQIIQDVPTPVHYFIVHFFLLFGRSTLILGLPSVILGVLSVFVIYKIGKKLSGMALGLTAAFLMAISTMNIEFSQQILHYSYLVFFSIVSLYLFVLLISDLASEKFRWWILLLLLSINGLNVLTHVSSFLVIAIELIFIFLYLIVQRKFLLKHKYWFLLIFVISLVLGYVLLIPGGGYYLKLLSDGVSFGPSRSVELGYSLSRELKTSVLVFNRSFFEAMFSWFGLGPKTVYLYFSLFLLGVVSLIRKKPLLASLFLFWVIYPFLQLYFIRPSHWFEEKYFIFIIPAYLLFIAEGVIFISAIISKILVSDTLNKKPFRKYIKTVLTILICLGIGTLAFNPFLTRTTYGFPIIVDDPFENYSWRKVHNYLVQNTFNNDRVFIQSGQGYFFDFYFPDNKKNTYWYEESYLYNIKGEEYSSFISKDCNNYFVSIPDVGDTYIAGAINYKKVDKIGGFNIYKIDFKKDVINKLIADQNNNWEYYDDFKNGRYLAESERWENLSTGYLGNFNLPVTYGYFNLSPTVFNENNSLNYKFSLPFNTTNVTLNPRFSLNSDASFRIVASSAGKTIGEYDKKTNVASLFSPSVDFSIPGNSTDLELSFSFKFDPNKMHLLGQNSLKSIWLHNVRENGVLNYESVSDNSKNSYYDAQLEVLKNNKWLQATSENERWIQTSDGILLAIAGDTVKPLIFTFKKLKGFDEAKLETKTFTLDNNIIISASQNGGKNWDLLQDISNKDILTTESRFKLTNDELLVKFTCKRAGSSCQVRGLSLQITKP